jgi:hypothetical protein
VAARSSCRAAQADSCPEAHRRTVAVHLPCIVRVVHDVVEDSSTEMVHHIPVDHQAAATAGERRKGFASPAMTWAIVGLNPEGRSIHPTSPHQEKLHRHFVACLDSIEVVGEGQCWWHTCFVGRPWLPEDACHRQRVRRSGCGTYSSCGA